MSLSKELRNSPRMQFLRHACEMGFFSLSHPKTDKQVSQCSDDSDYVELRRIPRVLVQLGTAPTSLYPLKFREHLDGRDTAQIGSLFQAAARMCIASANRLRYLCCDWMLPDLGWPHCLFVLIGLNSRGSGRNWVVFQMGDETKVTFLSNSSRTIKIRKVNS